MFEQIQTHFLETTVPSLNWFCWEQPETRVHTLVTLTQAKFENINALMVLFLRKGLKEKQRNTKNSITCCKYKGLFLTFIVLRSSESFTDAHACPAQTCGRSDWKFCLGPYSSEVFSCASLARDHANVTRLLE